MIKLMEMVKYRHIRPYTKVEMNRITDEYLNNNKYSDINKDDVLTKLQKIDQLEYLSEKELVRLNNSKIPSIKKSKMFLN